MISTNPVNNDVLWEGKAAGQKEIEQAFLNAERAFSKWSRQTMAQRVEHILAYQTILKKKKQSLATTISQEMGKILSESKSEVESMIGKIDISIAAQAKRCETLKEGKTTTRHRPLGVIGVISPFNFPAHLPNGHIVPALLAGNTVVLKPSPHTPLVAEEMCTLWKQAGLPEGVIELVQGGRETGRQVATHEALKALLFTGSRNVGVEFSKLLAPHPEKLIALEMGGNNPLVLSDVTDEEKACQLIAESTFPTTGQRCTAARRLIVVETKKTESILSCLQERMRNLKIGPYTQTPEPDMGPLIDREAGQALLLKQELLEKQGARVVQRMVQKENSAFVTPALIDVTECPHVDEELFGPLLQLIRVQTFDQAVQVAGQTAFGLSASLLSDHQKEWNTFYREIRAGIINWNAPTTGASSFAPFGGVGLSGNHRPTAFYAADYCNDPVVSTIGNL